MANSKIKVDTARIKEANQIIDAKTTAFKDSYEKIYSLSKEIFDSQSWLGKDAQVFNEQLDGFKNDFFDLHNKLDEYSLFLKKAADAYEVVQGDVTTKAGKLKADRK